MSGCLAILLAVTQFFFALFKLTGVGDVKGWSWLVVLIPTWVFLCFTVIFLIRACAALLWEARSSRSSLSTEEGPIEAFWRKRRAKKHAKEQAKWGITQ